MQDDRPMKFYGLDGDKIGRVVETHIVKNEMDILTTFSNNVSSALDAIRVDVLGKQGVVVFCAGDSILFQGQFDDEWCKRILEEFAATTGRTASLGVGETVIASYLALKLAKALGGGMMLQLPPLLLPNRL